jgi:hypothetical protein
VPSGSVSGQRNPSDAQPRGSVQRLLEAFDNAPFRRRRCAYGMARRPRTSDFSSSCDVGTSCHRRPVAAGAIDRPAACESQVDTLGGAVAARWSRPRAS